MLARDIRESPGDGDDGIGGWPDELNRLADAITNFAEAYDDKNSIHAVVNAVLITPRFGIAGERGAAAHRYLWDRVVHLAEPEDRKRLIQSRPDFAP